MGAIIRHHPFLDHEMLTVIGSDFPDLIEGFDFSMHLKDAQTGKYILSNAHNRVLHKGIENLHSPDDLVGLTADDLCHIPPAVCKQITLKINADTLDRDYLKSIKELDYKARSLQYNQNIGVNMQYDSIVKEGFIYPTLRTERPIFSLDKRKTIAILTYGKDLTSQYSLSGLFQLYRKYYFDEQAIKLLLKHLKIDHHFIQLPTLREMQILLAMHQHPSRKRIARLLNISHNTVASHLQHLKEYKLIKPDFDEVLMHLRKAPMERERTQ